MQDQTFNIRDYGAIGDGNYLNTDNIQRAIDACTQSGGGRVYVPPGIFNTGTIILRSGVELHIEAGATLLASPHREDYRQLLYPVTEVSPDTSYKSGHFFCNLIFAHDADDIAITGRGIIDGQGRAFFTEQPQAPNYLKKGVRDWRPGHLISLVNCRDVLLRDIRLVDSPMYAVWPRTCDRVRIDNITILNDPAGPNTDGIDPDGCTDVIISNCSIDTGDDCIAVKSGLDWLSPGRSCEGIVVTNCLLKSTTCAIRIGYEGDAPIRDCTFSNLVIRRTRTGINMMVPYNEKIHILHGPTIENISFSNIVMETKLPLFLWIDDRASSPGCIRNINITDVQATAERACYLGGNPTLLVEGIRIRNLHLKMQGEMNGHEISSKAPYPYPAFDIWAGAQGIWPENGAAFHGLPYALYARYVRDIDIKDLRIDWTKASGHWHGNFHVEEENTVEISEVKATALPGTQAVMAQDPAI